MRPIRAYRARHPAWAATISAVLGPELGHYYLGLGWLGTLYLGLSLVMLGVLPFLLNLYLPVTGALIAVVAFLCYRAFGAFRAYRRAVPLQGQAHYPWFSRLYVWLLLFWLAPLALAHGLRSFVFQPFSIPATSMAPTLMAGDYAIADKFTYGISRYSLSFGAGPEQRIGGRLPERGEVVVFRLPSDPRVDYVKRVIGLPGDRVEMRDGVLLLNGRTVPRTDKGPVVLAGSISGELYEETLPGGITHPILDQTESARGDNTREFTVPADHYFVLGDNRDNSLDSRFEGVGFVPADNILARMSFIAFSTKSRGRVMQAVR